MNRFDSDLIRVVFVGTREGVVCICTKVWTDGALGLLLSYCVVTKALKKWILSLISLCKKFKVCVNLFGEFSHSMSLLSTVSWIKTCSPHYCRIVCRWMRCDSDWSGRSECARQLGTWPPIVCSGESWWSKLPCQWNSAITNRAITKTPL